MIYRNGVYIPPLDDSAVNGQTEEGITSNWAYDHAAATTAVHGVGAGTISSVSTANKSIYVAGEATGAADGTSWGDAFTTIQDAVDSMEDIIIHAYTIYVRHGTRKTGTADSDLANHLVDDGNSQFVSGDVGKRVFNITDGTWGVVGSYVDAGDLGIVDTDGANLDLFPDGDEEYVIEPTPYRETVYLNGDPANYPAHIILGSLSTEAEYYWYGNCEANVGGAGEITATGAFADVAIGDRVFVTDKNGAGGRTQDYELGTVDDIGNVPNRIGTTLTKTPTTLWRYTIVRTEISGSDDGTDGGTARSYCANAVGINNVSLLGFYMTFGDIYAVSLTGSRNWRISYGILEGNDSGIEVAAFSECVSQYIYSHCTVSRNLRIRQKSFFDMDFSVLITPTGSADYGILVSTNSSAVFNDGYIDHSLRGASCSGNCFLSIARTTISANSVTGLYALYNSCIYPYRVDNFATTPVDPVGTSEGAYIVA